MDVVVVVVVTPTCYVRIECKLGKKKKNRMTKLNVVLWAGSGGQQVISLRALKTVPLKVRL